MIDDVKRVAPSGDQHWIKSDGNLTFGTTQSNSSIIQGTAQLVQQSEQPCKILPSSHKNIKFCKICTISLSYTLIVNFVLCGTSKSRYTNYATPCKLFQFKPLLQNVLASDEKLAEKAKEVERAKMEAKRKEDELKLQKVTP